MPSIHISIERVPKKINVQSNDFKRFDIHHEEKHHDFLLMPTNIYMNGNWRHETKGSIILSCL